MFLRCVISCLLFVFFLSGKAGGENPAELYLKHCASCHHEQRYGLTAPPLIPEALGRQSDERLEEAITEGLAATNMPPFRDLLTDEEIKGLVGFIKSPLTGPEWGIEDMLKTRRLEPPFTGKPAHDYDLSNLFMVVEGGTGSVCVMDGESFKVLDRVKVGAVHGGPKYDYRYRYVYMVSRDGWVVKYDLYNLKEAGRIRVAINTRNIAVSSDNGVLAVANYLPANLVIMETETLRPVKIIDTGARVGAVYNLKGHDRFIATLKGKPELLLVGYGDEPYVERVKLPGVFDDIFLAPGGRYAVGTSRGGTRMTIFDMEKRKVVKELQGDGMPHLASAALWEDEKGGVYAAIPHIKSPTLTVIKLYDWTVVDTIGTKGPGFFARTHEKSDYIWVDTNTDTIQVIEKKTLRVVKSLTPEPGKKAMHIEFTKDGRYALVSIRETKGAIVVYDNKSLEEVKRLPFSRPVGKYNATNKTRGL